MDIWLDETETDKIIRQLNPQLHKGKQYDTNWELLKQEKPLHYNTEKTVKTQTPRLYVFEKNVGFSYRRHDGAHWHTELRELDLDKCGLTQAQHRLRDSINTLANVTNSDIKLTWITPYLKSGAFDPRYQIIKTEDTWLCCIENKIYAASNRKERKDKAQIEITFSTTNKPVFEQSQLDTLLDKHLGPKSTTKP